jgi:predicted ATPase/DNA-binding CsgD family transcriptional regulator
MVDVFVSYAREDLNRAQPIVNAIIDQGWDVWWDRDLSAGPRFDESIEQALDNAKLVIVLWSLKSVTSDWVKTEANEALDRGVLLPVLLDEVRLPLAFRRSQCIDLTSNRTSDLTTDSLNGLLDEITVRLTATVPEDGFVGRSDELGMLQKAVDNAIAGHGNLSLVAGEPGIGKTRLLQALEIRLDKAAINVHWGFSYEDVGLPPYFAWTQIIRECLETVESDLRQELLERWGGYLKLLLPELNPELQAKDTSAESLENMDQSRMQLFVAIAQFLFAVSSRRPLLLFFDNAHLLDEASIKLLEFITPQLRGKSIAVIATYRDTDIDRSHPLFFSLARLTQQPDSYRVSLAGLTAEEVGALCTQIAPQAVEKDMDLLLHVQERAEGNPLFVTELTQMISGTISAETRVPERIREVIAERLHRLDNDVDKALGVAAVIGRRFSAPDVASLLGERQLELVLDWLDIAQEAGFVDFTQGVGHEYRFRHELVRQSLYNEHSSARRIVLHRDLAEIFKARGEPETDNNISKLAHHLYEAGLGGNLEEAIQACQRAGEQANQVFAFAEAARQFKRALELLSLAATPEPGQKSELLLAQGNAEYSLGDTASARSSLLSACITAARSEQWHPLARALIIFREVGQMSDEVHRVCLPLHEQALEHLDEDDWMHTRLLASYASLLCLHNRYEEAQRIGELCLQRIRFQDDWRVKRNVLRHVSWMFEYVDLSRSYDIAEEIYEMAPRRGNELERLEAVNDVFCNCVPRGDIDRIRSLVSESGQLSVSVSHFHYRYLNQGMITALALLEGRWTDANKSAREQYELGCESGAKGVDGTYARQMFTLHWMLGKLKAAQPMLKAMSLTPGNIWTPGFALMASELDLREDARDAFELATKNNFESVPQQTERPLILGFLAEVCVYLGDRERAAELIELLEPYSEQNIGNVHTVMIGSTARYIAKLALLLGRRKEALAAFKKALDLNAAMGAKPWLALTQFDYARALLTGKRVDNEAALPLLQSAANTAEVLEMTGLHAQVTAILGPMLAGAQRLSNRETEVLELVALGTTNQDIADRLHVSPTTIATHMRNILRKTEASNRVEAVATARRTGWISTHE